jgi:outer membrane protein assembly factor BamE
MNKLLTLSAIFAGLLASGCSTTEKITSIVPDSISNWSLVHKATIQQGNILTEEALEELSPGMSKDEVRISLGSPSLVDVFHQERWDYIYSIDVPGKEPVLKTLSIYFSDDLVDRIEGEYEADETSEQEAKRVVVSVPDYQGEGIFKRTLKKIGIANEARSE